MSLENDVSIQAKSKQQEHISTTAGGGRDSSLKLRFAAVVATLMATACVLAVIAQFVYLPKPDQGIGVSIRLAALIALGPVSLAAVNPFGSVASVAAIIGFLAATLLALLGRKKGFALVGSALVLWLLLGLWTIETLL